jgi:uncharacterized membrane protein
VNEETNIPPPPASRGFQLNGPTVVSLLYLATYFTVFTALVGVILAYLWKRQEAAEWERGHYLYLIRTFWLGIGGYAAAGGLILALMVAFESNSRVMSGVAIAAAVAAGLVILVLTVALLVRCVMSLVNAQQNVPMPKPRSWTI